LNLFNLEADRQSQIQEEKEQNLQLEIEADRQRVRQEKQEADRKRHQEMEADRLRLRQEKEASDRKRELEMEADRLRLRQQQQQSKIPDRISPEILRQSRQVTPKIKSKLEKLCGSDYRLAQRLVDGIQFDHPDRSEQWCWEKAIRDMERDRRY
jgi:hypothetical protein